MLIFSVLESKAPDSIDDLWLAAVTRCLFVQSTYPPSETSISL